MSNEHLHCPTVVLDLDGTLVDSVHHHVVAWTSAFHDVGLRVASTTVHHAIGMGGDRLVSHVAGAAAESAVGDDVRGLHDKYFRAGLRTISELDGASDLLTALAERGHHLVLASSSEADLVDELLDRVGGREPGSTSSSAAPRRSTASPPPTWSRRRCRAWVRRAGHRHRRRGLGRPGR